MHMPGHNFTGRGTKLNKQLNEDMTPKPWSKLVNRVDKAAYHHDICYVKNKDTKTRNEVCDKNMLTELNSLTTARANKLPCPFLAINRQPLELELFKPSTDSASLLVDIEKKNFCFWFGVCWGERHKWGRFCIFLATFTWPWAPPN